MNRRDFIHIAAAGVVTAGAQVAALAQKKEQQEPPAGSVCNPTIAKESILRPASSKNRARSFPGDIARVARCSGWCAMPSFTSASTHGPGAEAVCTSYPAV